jgi:hypothetical protein
LERHLCLRTGAAGLARRASITLRSARTEKAPAIAKAVGLSENTVRRWFRRIVADGAGGSAEFPRSARPWVCSEVRRGKVIPSALIPPEKLEKPFRHWTLGSLEQVATPPNESLPLLSGMPPLLGMITVTPIPGRKLHGTQETGPLDKPATRVRPGM